MKLLETYKSILSTAGLFANNDGCVAGRIGSEELPITIKGKRLVLPITEQLRNFDKDSKVVFHPLNESVTRGTSDVLEKYRSLVTMRINTILTVVMRRLIILASSVDDHKRLKPDQLGILTHMKNADAKTLQNFDRLSENMPTNESNKGHVSMFLKRGPTLNGRKWARGCIVSFPLYDELLKNRTVYGVKLRNSDYDCIIGMFSYIFDGIEKENAYSRGSDSDVAPFMDALMKGVLAVVEPINDIIERYSDVLADTENKDDQMLFNVEWAKTFENLLDLQHEINMIPMQAGNEGALPNQAAPIAESTPVEQKQTTAAAAPPAKKELLSPFGPAPTDANRKEEIPSLPTVMPLVQSAPVRPVQQAMHPMQPMNSMQPMQQYPMGYPSNQMQMHQQPQQHGVVRTAGGVDFDSVLRSNPNMAFAAAQGAAAFGMMPMGSGMPMNAGRVPSWAAPNNGYFTPAAPQQQFQNNGYGMPMYAVNNQVRV